MAFGSMLGAIISGKTADFMGRRGDVWWHDLGRLSLGFSSGLQIYVVVFYVAEITQKDYRGRFVMAMQLMICGGVILMFFIGNIISWRILAFIGMLPCLIQGIGVLFIPESPRWLAKVGREKELEASLRLLRGKDTDISQEAAQILDSSRPFEEQRRSGFGQLLERRYARPLVVGIVLSILIPWAGGNGVFFYASSVFAAAVGQKKKLIYKLGCTVSMATTAIALIQLPFSVLGVLLMDKFERGSLLMIDLTGLCLGSALAGLAFSLQHSELGKDLTPTLVFVSMLIFPINIKGTAGSIALVANSFSSWTVSYAFGFLFAWSSAGVFLIFAGVCGLLIPFVAKMLPETKGLSLEEIQALWTQEPY